MKYNKPISVFILEDAQTKKRFSQKVVPVPPDGILDAKMVCFDILDEEFEIFKDNVVNTLIGLPMEDYEHFKIKRYNITDSVEFEINAENFLNSALEPNTINLVDEIRERLMCNQPGRSIFTDKEIDLNPVRPIKASLENYHSFIEKLNLSVASNEHFKKILDFFSKKPEMVGSLIEDKGIFLTHFGLNSQCTPNDIDLINEAIYEYLHRMGYKNSDYTVVALLPTSEINIVCSNITYFEDKAMLLQSGLDSQKLKNVFDKLALSYPNLFKNVNQQVLGVIDNFLEQPETNKNKSSKTRNLKM